MNFKQFSALMILNGRSRRRVKKCLFSVTKASAPVHSTYAAIKASADFRPIASYLAPNAKGIKLSSSILVKSFMKSINSLNASGVKLLLISSTIKRGIRRVSLLAERTIFSSTFSHRGSRTAPRAKIYMLLSSTRNKLRLPELCSNFADFVNNFLLVFPFVSGACFRHKVANFFQAQLCLFDIGFYHVNHLWINNSIFGRGSQGRLVRLEDRRWKMENRRNPLSIFYSLFSNSREN